MKRISLLLITLTMVIPMAFAQLSDYTKKEYIIAGDTLRYRELKPAGNAEKYPLVVFLHGSGERGSDNEKQLTWGAQMFLNPVNRAKYPAYVIFPQCPENGYWAFNERPESFMPEKMPILENPTTAMRMLRALIKQYIAEGNVDSRRVYLIGLSMGAMAVYDFACRNSGMIAAAVPICGSVNPAIIKNLKDTNWSIYHGDADNVVPVEGSRAAYRKLKEIGASVRYHEFVGCNHGSWNPAFNSPDFMKWLFDQSRSHFYD